MAPDLGKKQNQANENGASSRPAGPKSVYVKPKEVLFPMDRVNKVVEVLYDGGEGGFSVAILDYVHAGGTHRKEAVAIRWNGAANEPIGFPSIGQFPAWFLVPEELASTIRFLSGQQFQFDLPLGPKNAEQFMDLFGSQFSTEALARALKDRGYNISVGI